MGQDKLFSSNSPFWVLSFYVSLCFGSLYLSLYNWLFLFFYPVWRIPSSWILLAIPLTTYLIFNVTMPRVHEIRSLVKLSADCIRKSIEKNKYAGYPREVKPNVDANASIHELRKFTTESPIIFFRFHLKLINFFVCY
jgi:hypothetical protein